MADRNELAAYIERRRSLGVRCEVSRCGLPTYQLSRYCRRHALADWKRGSPTGVAIRQSDLKPFHKAAVTFIERNRRHPGIQGALVWCRQLIEGSAKLPPPRRPARVNTPEVLLGERARYIATVWDGPEEWLALVAGMYALREFQAQRFTNDRHWRMQLGHRCLSLPRRTAQSLKEFDTRFPAPVALRLWLGRRIEEAIGVLCQRIGEEVAKGFAHRSTLPDIDRPSGQAEPFTPPQHT